MFVQLAASSKYNRHYRVALMNLFKRTWHTNIDEQKNNQF